jgi:RND family efflux transporter MFP subunit
VDLAFQVSGPLTELPIKNGQDVKEGELLARIDPRDFENALSAKHGTLAKAQSDIKKLNRLFEQGNAGRQEVVDAQAVFDVAEAEYKIAAKALEDTNLRAPFAGVIAQKFVENFENVGGKQPILSLQDISSVEIEVNIPEEVAVVSRGAKDAFRFVATFDYLPGRDFAVTPKEFTTEADPLTQTYAATLVMPAPDDVNILPGMTATITPYRLEASASEDSGYAVPIDAVPVDGMGTYFVWKTERDAGGAWAVHRVDVKVGEMMQNEILIVEGLTKGDRIAAAGVHVLQEGQRVRPLNLEAGADQP